jgi:hypothetical protein
VSTTDGVSAFVQDIILASDSYKFYKPANPSNDSKYDSVAFGLDRETPIAQDYGRIGYYIVTVDSARVWVDYYAVASGQTGGVIASVPPLTGNWVKRETFGYGLNGKEFLVPQGSSYAVVVDSCGGTVARILSGINTGTAMDSSGRACTQVVGTGWSSPEASATGKILTLWGMTNAMGSDQTCIYTLSMNYASSILSASMINGKFGLVTKSSDGVWINAADGNFGGAKKFVLGPWAAGAALGDYGIDTNAHIVWAAINYAGDFAVADFDRVGVSKPVQQRAIPKRSRIYLKGSTMILPENYSGKKVIVSLLTLSGRLLFRAETLKNIVDVSSVNRTLKNREVVAVCAVENIREIQKVFLY